jgi:uncharacterized membrane protein
MQLARSAVLWLRTGSWSKAIYVAGLIWSVGMTALVRRKFLDFDLQRYDFGNMIQAVWSTANGRPLEATLGSGAQASRLASHVDPILVLLAPLWLLVPSPLTLAAVQIGACAAGALPIYWLGRRHLRSDAAAGLMALAYLVYPWLAWAALEAIHPVTLAVPLLLYGIWFLDTERLHVFAAFAVLAAMSGELVGLIVAGLGLWYWACRGHRRAGIAIALLGTAWTIVAIKVVVPAFAGSESAFHSYYEHIGGSPERVIWTAISAPGEIISTVSTEADVLYFVALVIPLLGTSLLSPGLALVALPILAANALSSLVWLTNPRAHHVSTIIPILAAASVFGVARFPPHLRRVVAAAVLASCVLFSALLGPWPGSPGQRVQWNSWYYGRPTNSHIDAVRDAVALVPPGVPVASTNKAGAHLSARRHYYSIPRINEAEWLLIDNHDPWVPLAPPSPRTTWGRFDPALVGVLIRRLSRSPDWDTVFVRDGVYVFRRDEGDQSPRV